MIVTCPGCASRYRVEDEQAVPGRRLRCDHCDTRWTVEDEPETMLTDAALVEVPDDYEEEPRRRGFVRRHWAAILGVIVLLFGAVLLWLVVTAPLGRALEPLKEPSLVILDVNGTPIARRGNYKEQPVTIAELPKYVPLALIAIEDRRFYSHWGIDPQGIARAMFRNASAGGVAQGGSTLTQQLAKTSFLTPTRSIKRKLQEVIIAFYLESRLTKDEILSRYLSSVYFGEGAYGIRAAARTYFNRTPADLTVGQAAMLAGLVKAPSALAPSRHLKAAQARQKIVLQSMVETGALTANQARNVSLARYTPGRAALPTGSYFADWVLPQAKAATETAQYGDTRVPTTLDPQLQKMAERAVRDTLAGYKGLNVTQAALVAMRPDGRVVAMVGGTDYDKTSFNRATQALRQPGSSFKLFVYLAAFHAGMTPNTIVDDTPITEGEWQPKNDEGKYRGAVPLITAFAASSNVASARLTQQLGVDAVRDQARRLGITSPLSNYEGLALGTSGVPLIELTSAYAAVAAGRYPVKPIGLSNPVREGVAGQLRGVVQSLRPWPEREYMLQMLKSAVARGTGVAATLPIPTYGKTGTTQNHRDALFVGFAGDLVVGVWVGNDNNSPMGGSVVGGTIPAKLWKRFMTAALTHEGQLREPPPRASVLDDVRDAFDRAGVAADAVDAVGGILDEVTGGGGDGRDERGFDRGDPYRPDEPPPEPDGPR